MNSPLSTPSGFERESFLYAQFRSKFNVATETGEVRDAIEAISASDRWLLVNQPDDSRRTEIPKPQLLQNVLAREGRSS
jgi:hypothetical protein